MRLKMIDGSTKTIVQDYSARFVDAFDNYPGRLVNPNGTNVDRFLMNPGDPNISKRRKIVYALFNSGLFKKIGSTTKMVERVENYQRNNPGRDLRFLNIINLDDIPEDLDNDLNQLYQQFISAMVADGSGIPMPMKYLLRTIHYRGGQRLGLKTKMVLLMLEYGCQLLFGPESASGSLAKMMECFMFDRLVFAFY